MVVNGKEHALSDEASSISKLIASLGLDPRTVAVELNGAIAPRLKWDETMVAADDRLEIIRFVGGG